jgi:hypothetical protein
MPKKAVKPKKKANKKGKIIKKKSGNHQKQKININITTSGGSSGGGGGGFIPIPQYVNNPIPNPVIQPLEIKLTGAPRFVGEQEPPKPIKIPEKVHKVAETPATTTTKPIATENSTTGRRPRFTRPRATEFKFPMFPVSDSETNSTISAGGSSISSKGSIASKKSSVASVFSGSSMAAGGGGSYTYPETTMSVGSKKKVIPSLFLGESAAESNTDFDVNITSGRSSNKSKSSTLVRPSLSRSSSLFENVTGNNLHDINNIDLGGKKSQRSGSLNAGGGSGLLQQQSNINDVLKPQPFTTSKKKYRPRVEIVFRRSTEEINSDKDKKRTKEEIAKLKPQRKLLREANKKN